MEPGFGSTDCERIGTGLLSQPINALTSLAFVPAGLWIARRRPGRREFATLTALVGVGSFLAHGPRWPGSVWAHDVTLAWSLAAIAADGWSPSRRRAVLASIGALFAAVPKAAQPVSVGLAAAAIGRELRTRPTAETAPVLGFAALGAAIGTMARTGWPWCRPDSLFQGHGVWHVLAAAALTAWGTGSPPGPAATPYGGSSPGDPPVGREPDPAPARAPRPPG
jgi:hypothetical protein